MIVYPLEERYGLPDGSRRVEATKRSPATLRLQPGPYLVVVALDDGRFHEVYRTVPENKHGMPSKSYAHTRWLTRVDGTVEWPEIDIPSADVANGMGKFDGAARFQVGEAARPQTPKHNRFVAAFHLDAHETTWGEFLARNRNRPPVSIKRSPDQFPPDNMPIASIWYDDALMHAERCGKRLPSEVEYEFAATAGGTRRFPWGDDSERLKKWTFGPVGTPKFDRIDAGVPVFGLYSNVAEWTCSWASAYPPRLDYQPAFPLPHEGTYIVRGGPPSVIAGDPNSNDILSGPRNRVAQHEKTLKPGIGFRCARSVRPRLKATDLERYLRD